MTKMIFGPSWHGYFGVPASEGFCIRDLEVGPFCAEYIDTRGTDAPADTKERRAGYGQDVGEGSEKKGVERGLSEKKK